jgi:hypothetical protein
MRASPTRCFIVLFCLLGGIGAAQEPWQNRFDDERADQVPSGFTFATMRQSHIGRWFVHRTAADSCLAHQADVKATGYSLAIADREAPGDLSLSVRLHTTGGARTGGLVWRYQNDQNFYTLLLDLSHGEVAVYRISSGNRVRLDVDDGLELDADAWHTVKVTHADSSLRVMLGGIRVFEEQDRRYDHRSLAAGRVGVVATGNSDVCFDDLTVETRRGRR